MNNSEFLQEIGLGNVDIGIILLIIAIVNLILLGGLIYAVYENVKFRKVYKKFMKGSTAESLEDKIFQISEEQDSLRKVSNKHSREIKDLYALFENDLPDSYTEG